MTTNIQMPPATIGSDMRDGFDAFSATTFQLTANTPLWRDQYLTAPIVVQAFAASSWLMPFHVRSGPRKISDDGRRKWIRGIVFHRVGVGAASLKVRVWVDGRLICVGGLEMDETPIRSRKISLPRGTCGYTLDIEIVGNAPIRHVEAEWEDMAWEE